MSDPFEELRPHGPFSVVLADPPWAFALRSAKGNGKSPDQHYDTMSLEQIKALPVASLGAKDSVLVLWATFPMLDFARETMAAWGFTYKTGGSWIKTTVNGKLAFGTGFVLRSASELFLIGTRGSPKTLSKSVRNVMSEPEEQDIGVLLQSQRREHSRKPDEQYDMIEKLWDGPKLELFAREAKRPGWTYFGNEVDYPFQEKTGE